MRRKKRPLRDTGSGRNVDRAHGKIDLAQAYKLRVVNRLSFGEIAKTLNVPKSSVHAALQRLHKLVPDPDAVKAYEEVRPTLLTAIEHRLMASLTDEEAVQKASLNNRAYAFQQIFNARRLETGQSTQNLSLMAKLMGKALEDLYNSPDEGASRKSSTTTRLNDGLDS